MRARWIGVVCVVAAIALGTAASARAQQTRDEEHAAEQAAKAAQLHPYVPTSAERLVERVESLVYGPPTTVFPFFGSAFPGGGLALGPAFRAPIGDSGVFGVHGAWSVKNYLVADGALTLPKLADGMLTLTLGANWLRAPEVAFYGIGKSSSSDDKASFFYRTTTAGGSARFEPGRVLAVGAGVDYFDVATGGTSGTSVEEVFAPDTTPGLGADVTYVRSRAFAEIDWRQSPGYTTSGGLYRLDWTNYGARRDAPYSFTRLDAEVDQFVPIFRGSSVIALRAMGSFTDTNAGQAVPYFLLPDLGGARYLRGYRHWRFRDRNRMLLTGEYRWTAGQFIDMALFLDAGKVARRVADLDLKDLNTSYGIGIRFHAPAATLLRVELAQTRDAGIGIIFAFGPSF